MKIIRGLHNLRQHQHDTGPGCALSIGKFDGVHRGHQAMLALLTNEARHRGLVSCAMIFEPHPNDYFAQKFQKPELARARIATLRDKLDELRRCGIEQCVILPFDDRLANQTAEDFIQHILVNALGVRYVLVGDDFHFGANRQGDYTMLDQVGTRLGFDVARMMSYEVHGLRVSSSAVRRALAQGQMDEAAALLGRPYAISGHVIHGAKLGRKLGSSSHEANDGFRTLNLRFNHWKPAARGIFAVHVHGLDPDPKAHPLMGVANLGVRPSLDPHDINGGRVLLETHCLEWPESVQAALSHGDAYGKIIQVDLLHKLHDEFKYDSLPALTQGIAQDCANARAWFAQREQQSTAQHAAVRRQTTRDRI